MDLLLVNGVRMANNATLPAEVDAHGAILALTDERDAILFRPDDAALPDLRVVVGLATETVTPDGDPVDVMSLGRGDSVRVKGRAEQGFVVAERLTVPRRFALDAAPPADAGAAQSASEPATVAAAASAPRPVRAAPAPVRVLKGHGRGRGGGRGHGKGRG